MASNKKRNYGRWCHENGARVISYFDSRGKLRLYAQVSIPVVPYAFVQKGKYVSSIEGGHSWIREQAEAWATEEGVIFIG